MTVMEIFSNIREKLVRMDKPAVLVLQFVKIYPALVVPGHF